MSATVAVDSDAVRHAASTLASSSQALHEATDTFAAKSTTDATTFGNSTASAGAHNAYSDAQAQAVRASNQLRELLARHAEALRAVGDAFDRAEDDAALIAKS
jgi:uncharacterized protein YukE